MHVFVTAYDLNQAAIESGCTPMSPA